MKINVYRYEREKSKFPVGRYEIDISDDEVVNLIKKVVKSLL